MRVGIGGKEGVGGGEVRGNCTAGGRGGGPALSGIVVRTEHGGGGLSKQFRIACWGGRDGDGGSGGGEEEEEEEEGVWQEDEVVVVEWMKM